MLLPAYELVASCRHRRSLALPSVAPPSCKSRNAGRCGRLHRRPATLTRSQIASWSQSVRISTTCWKLPEVSPFFHSACARTRPDNGRCRSRWSAPAPRHSCARPSAACRRRASVTTAVTSPCASKRGVKHAALFEHLLVRRRSGKVIRHDRLLCLNAGSAVDSVSARPCAATMVTNRTCSSGLSLNTPVKVEVSVVEPCLRMPRMAMHIARPRS